MGRRGPPKTPTPVLKLHGSRKAEGRENEPKPEPGRPTCPTWLSKEAKAMWRKVVPQLEKMGVLTKIDGNALARYCALYVRYVAAEKFLKEYGTTYSSMDKNGNPKFFQHSQVSEANQLAQRLDQLERQFGMTPASRPEIQVPAAGNQDNSVSSFARSRSG